MTTWTFNSDRIVCGIHKHTIQRRGPWGLSGPCLGQGILACTHVWCIVLRVCALLTFVPSQLTGSTWQTHSPLQSNSQPANWHKQLREAEATHNNNKQAEKQAGWRKSGRWKVKRVVKSEKWKTVEQNQMIGATVEWNRNRKKDISTYVDKPTTVQGGDG